MIIETRIVIDYLQKFTKHSDYYNLFLAIEEFLPVLILLKHGKITKY